jgi:phosphoserine aminotransferase
MINFYPGPSKIYPEYRGIVHDLLTSGLATYNHRSVEFEQAYAHTLEVVKNRLEVPEDYEMVFLSSATECWQSICQTFYQLDTCFLYNGAFGKKWAEVGKIHIKTSRQIEFNLNESIQESIGKIYSADLICYVHNETSNGTVVRKPYQQHLRKTQPNALIAVDATSSIGATQIDYQSADIVFGSVQKCLGMPAGLAILILSPKAVKALEKIEYTRHYNDLHEILRNHKKNQTTHTPNILAIVAMGKLFESIPSLRSNIEKIYSRADNFENFLEVHGGFEFVCDKIHRSKTVFCVRHPNVPQIINQAKIRQIVLGRGYGNLANNTLRIANFPTHTDGEFEELKEFLMRCK